MSVVFCRRYFVILAVLMCAYAFSAFGQTLQKGSTGAGIQSSKEPVKSKNEKPAKYIAYYSGEAQFEIDLDSVQQNGNIVSFWERLILPEKMRKEYINYQLNIIKMDYPQGIPQDVYDKWSGYRYTNSRYAIDCDNVLSRGLEMVFYNSDGKSIDSVESPKSKWNPIEPDSIGMEKYKLICDGVHPTGIK